MIELTLRKTWLEITEYLSNNPKPLRLAELINRVPPCCWTFRFTFDGNDHISVQIDCDTVLSDKHVLSLLDGSLEELFFVDILSLRQTGKYVTVDTSELLNNPPSSNQIVLSDNLDEEVDSLLTLKGFWQSNTTPLEIQQYSTVCSYFLENTWAGSPNYVGSEYNIRWIVFGTEQLIKPRNRYMTKLETTNIFTTRSSLYNANGDYIGQANFHTSPLLEESAIYTMFGPLVPRPYNWMTKNLKHSHWIVEIENKKLKQNVTKGKSDTKLANELIDSIENALTSVTESLSFQNYKHKIELKQQAKAANSLKKRQERARKGARIIYNDSPIMLVPSNENEVLVLLSKLDALKALPFHEFILWEYTARSGIDAIATYQTKETSRQTMFAMVEIEYFCENFFEHGHPHHQVDMVICWNFRNRETSLESHKYRKHSEWLFEYRNDNSFFIFVLSRIPNLQIKEDLNNEQRG